MIFRKIILLLSVSSLPFVLFAQTNSNRHHKTVFVTSDTLTIDTLSLVPGSIILKKVNGADIDTSAYQINFAESKIVFKQKTIDSLQISYQTFPHLFSAEKKHKDVAIIKASTYNNNHLNPFAYTISSSDNDIFKTEGLDKSGSISRGISFGNTQNLVVNSNLNLQVSGKINNEVEILLAATDSNIPIQPEGNTQQLQEFDKVFIQLSKDQTKLIAGDYQLMRPNSYFMSFYKKSQGLSFSTEQKIHFKEQSPSAIYRTTTSAGVSRGKFSRNKIQGVEGNQGPYRLIGAENETYIIILSGTERVYIDGRLLTRGQENDYIIDYNTSEITFTAKQLITKDKRIIVEFQYTDKNYARSLVFWGNEFEKEKIKLHLNIYSEQDSKNQPLKQDLSDAQKKILSDVGDTLSLAVSPGYDSVAYSNNEVLYKKTDTIIGSTSYSVFTYSTNSDSAKYRVTFSNVGQGNGNYLQLISSTNGKVFRWIAPDSSTQQKKGSYEPVIILISPKQKQMITAGVDYELLKNTNISVEGVVTNNDINTFSTKDNQDDVGYGIKIDLENSTLLKKDSSSNDLFVVSAVSYEFVQHYFSPIERYRSVEFERDWNRSNTDIINDQHLVGGGVHLKKKQVGTIGYRVNGFFEKNNYDAVKHYGDVVWKKNGFNIDYAGSLLNSQSTSHTNFYRHLSTVSQAIKGLTLGYKDYLEQNKFSLNKKDSLISNSYRFWEWQGYIQNTDTTQNRYGAYYKQRIDYSLKSTLLTKSMLGESYGAFMELIRNPNSQLKVNTSYRILHIIDSSIATNRPDETILSRIEYSLRLFKGFIYSNTFYEIGSGLEVKKEYSYIEVAAGQGVYTWIDYNNNGVKELNEFEIAAFPGTATYLRIYTPTNDYIETYNNQFSEQLMIKPAALWAGKSGIRKFIARFANQTTYRIDRKTSEHDYTKAYNPFVPEAQLINNSIYLNSSFRNTFFINQLSPVVGLDLTYQNIKNINLLVNGLDTRQNIFQEARLRWNILQSMNWNLRYKYGTKNYVSEYFESRNYLISYQEIEPKFSYQPNTAFRITLLYKYSIKNNSVKYGNEKATLNDYGIELKYNVLQQGSLNAKVNLIDVTYNAVQNTSLAFEMLDAFQLGQNLTWGLSYQRNLSGNMQLSLNYDGRKSETSKAIHTGGAQIRAYF